MTKCPKCEEEILEGEDVIAVARGVNHGGVIEHMTIGEVEQPVSG